MPGSVFDKKFDLTRLHNEQRIAGVTRLEQRVASGYLQLIDYPGEGDSIVFVKKFEHLDVGKKAGITGHWVFLSRKETEHQRAAAL